MHHGAPGGLRIAVWALGAALALASSTAGAQVLQVSSGGTSFGPADCDDGTWGTSGHTDAAVNLTYQYQTRSTEIAGSQKIQLFATRSSCPAVASNTSSVTEPSDAISIVAANTPATSGSQNASIKVSQLASPAGGCATPQTTTWNVCFYEFYQPQPYVIGQSTDYQSASATVQLTYDSQPPGAPRLDAVTPGDQHLRVSFTAPGDDDVASYQVLVLPSGTAPQSLPVAHLATSSSSGSTGTAGSSGSSGSTGTTGTGSSSGSSGSTGTSSSSSSSSGSGSSSGTTGYAATACINGPVLATLGSGNTDGLVPGDGSTLVNGTSYDVQVRAVDKSGNVGACSNVVTGTPQQIDDFWRLYKKDGGSESGGCAQAGSGLALLGLLGAAVLLGRPRKKDRQP